LPVVLTRSKRNSLNSKDAATNPRRAPGLAAGLILAFQAITPTLAADSPPPVEPPSQQQTQYAVAGLAPYARPANAPVVRSVHRDEQWRAQALRGVSEPLPASLSFLDNQGAWYTPFNLPGMTGPYDIRGLHSAPAR
jgi:hypothetical protein